MPTRIAPIAPKGPIGDAVAVPIWLIRDTTLSAEDKLLYLAITLEAAEEEQVEGEPALGSVASLAEGLKWSVGRVRAHLRPLLARGLVGKISA